MEKQYKAKVSEILTRKHSEKRWVITDESNNILDDNHGEGYTSANKAFTKYELKEFGETTKDKERRIGKKEKEQRSHK